MTLILTHSDIVDLLDRDATRKAVQAAHTALAAGDYANPPPAALPLADDGTALPMAAAADGLVSVKLLRDLPANIDRDLARQRSTIMVASAVTGECVAILDGRAITVVRTAAASAVATDHLARRDASILGLIGAGNLAVEHAYAIAAVRDITEIVVWSRTPATADAFRSRTAPLGVPVQHADTIPEVVATADIVCTLTPAREPVLHGDWLRPGQHVNSVGAPPRADHRELDSNAMRRARIVVDSHPTVMVKSGAVRIAIDDGATTEDDTKAELGQVIIGTAAGRTTDLEITVFESVGIGLQDLVTAELVINTATARGIGSHIELSA